MCEISVLALRGVPFSTERHGEIFILHISIKRNKNTCLAEKMRIILIGFMLSGKSVVGAKLAAALNYDFIDIDSIIEKREGRKISAIFSADGEDYFRSVESTVSRELPDWDNIVISTGGGIVLNEQNMDYLKSSFPNLVVYLKVNVQTILKRMKVISRLDRPLLSAANVRERIKDMLVLREPLYEKYADISVETDNLSAEKVVRRIYDEYKTS